MKFYVFLQKWNCWFTSGHYYNQYPLSRVREYHGKAQKSRFQNELETNLKNKILKICFLIQKISKSKFLFFDQKLIWGFQLFYYYGWYLPPECWDEKEKLIFGLFSERRYFLNLNFLKNIQYSKSYGHLKIGTFFPQLSAWTM